MDRIETACPTPSNALVIVTGGQSNAANTNAAMSAAPSGAQVFDFYDGKCYASRDPVLGASGSGGSLWPRLGAEVFFLTGRPVLMLHSAIGGTQVEDWLDARSGYLDSLTSRIMRLREAGYEPDLVIWHQGETDAAVVTNMTKVYDSYSALMNALHVVAPEAVIYLFQASKCIGMDRENGVPGFTAAQVAVANSLDFVIEGANTDALGNSYRWDSCHFNNDGRAEIVNRIRDRIVQILQRRN